MKSSYTHLLFAGLFLLASCNVTTAGVKDNLGDNDAVEQLDPLRHNIFGCFSFQTAKQDATGVKYKLYNHGEQRPGYPIASLMYKFYINLKGKDNADVFVFTVPTPRKIDVRPDPSLYTKVDAIRAGAKSFSFMTPYAGPGFPYRSYEASAVTFGSGGKMSIQLKSRDADRKVTFVYSSSSDKLLSAELDFGDFTMLGKGAAPAVSVECPRELVGDASSSSYTSDNGSISENNQIAEIQPFDNEVAIDQAWDESQEEPQAQ